MIERYLTKSIVGLTLEKAVELAGRYGWVVRVTHTGYIGTLGDPYRPERINISASSGVVTSVLGWG